MIFEFNDLQFNIDFFHTVNNDKPHLLFLHGFTGSTDDWKSIYSHIDQNFSSFGIDLIGHGKSSSPKNIEFYSAEAIANQISKIINHTIKRKVIPIGYSMGGRAALTFAVKHPEMIEAIILESTSPGIEDKRLSEERVKKDDAIALFIENHTIDEFANYWMSMEIFNTQRRFSAEKRKQLQQKKIKNNITGLANSLRGFGTGTMPPLFNQLKSIKCKTLLITGELDTKFTNINNEIAKLFPNAEHETVKSAGHNIHLEEPIKFAEAVNDFLKSLN
jgi:2-succinyl-6-hydroxy-2,4-cyclohexadiene-1-carboxylate synthase